MKVLKSPISFSLSERLLIETPTENFRPFFLYFFITSTDFADDNSDIWYLHGYSSKRDKSLPIIIFSAIDNLVKGASGQAVQNMNILYGYPENLGLKWKKLLYFFF